MIADDALCFTIFLRQMGAKILHAVAMHAVAAFRLGGIKGWVLSTTFQSVLCARITHSPCNDTATRLARGRNARKGGNTSFFSGRRKAFLANAPPTIVFANEGSGLHTRLGNHFFRSFPAAGRTCLSALKRECTLRNQIFRVRRARRLRAVVIPHGRSACETLSRLGAGEHSRHDWRCIY